ncbi:hypothetical protein PRIPAC_73827, partial [Pristionchus pacificus]|uniref:Uncharacterized protein n=1 Tax=Pristionchus pacificus TaxID=54126 RepID=A0A2A6BF37_PRIPA
MKDERPTTPTILTPPPVILHPPACPIWMMVMVVMASLSIRSVVANLRMRTTGIDEDLAEEGVRLELIVIPQRYLREFGFCAEQQVFITQSSIVEALVPEGHRSLGQNIRLSTRFLTGVHGDGALVGTSVWEQRGGKDGGLRVGKELVVVRLKNGFHKMLNYYFLPIVSATEPVLTCVTNAPNRPVSDRRPPIT